MAEPQDMNVQVAWTTPQIKANLEAISKEADALAAGRVVVTEEGRAVVTLVQRLVETLVHGTPVTKPQSKHHV